MSFSCRSVLKHLVSFSALPTKADSSANPDVETASIKYQKRFSSKTGEWFLSQQAAVLLSMLKEFKQATILDVGGGHCQYTRQILDQGHSVTILGSSINACEQVDKLIESNNCHYMTGDFSRFPLPDKSMDVVISFRLMAHLEDWQGFIREASRVAVKAIIVDFPPLFSFNLAYPLFFKLKYVLERGTTRPFKIFREDQLIASFDEFGFVQSDRYAQYFFPMFMHRVLHSAGLSKTLEHSCRRIGLTDHFGAPVILKMKPLEPHQSL